MEKLMIQNYSDYLYIKELYENDRIAYDEEFRIAIYDNYPLYGYIVSTYGRVFSIFSHRQLKGTYGNDGYTNIMIYNPIFDNAKRIRIHRLVMMTFKPIINPEKFQVNHINGIKDDNRLCNLEWCTALENVHHAWITGLTNLKGDNHPLSVFSENIIHDFCKRLERGETYQSICDHYGILDAKERIRTRDIIYKIINKETYTYISSQYNIPDHLPYEKKRLNRIGIDTNDVYTICKLLEDGKTYREISDILYDRDHNIDKKRLKDLMYSIIGGESYQKIASNYSIQKPKSEREPLFTSDQIHIICKELSKGKKSPEILLENFGINIDSLEPNKKHCIINCISNIKTKKQFKYISDLYF